MAASIENIEHDEMNLPDDFLSSGSDEETGKAL
jgi:hypothetical protein